MKVCFLHVEGTYPPEEVEIHRALAKRMIDSVKRYMGCEVVQMTDPATPSLDGVDAVSRLNPAGMCWISYSLELMQRQAGEVLFLDTDCVVQDDLSRIFRHEFDVALTLKGKRFALYVDPMGTKHYLPSNGGVMFSRCPRFWRAKREIVDAMTDPMARAWWGGGIALNQLIERGEYKVLWLDAERYNYAPKSPDEDLRDKLVVHYRGRKRKHWNLAGSWSELAEAREMAIGA